MSVMICLGNPRTMEEIKVMITMFVMIVIKRTTMTIVMFVMIVMIKRTTMMIGMMILLGDDRGGGSRW